MRRLITDEPERRSIESGIEFVERLELQGEPASRRDLVPVGGRS